MQMPILCINVAPKKYSQNILKVTVILGADKHL
nr:hypothetical protein EATA8330_44720 [Enterobacter asburiae]